MCPEVYLQAISAFGDWKPTVLMERASRTLEEAEEPLTKTSLARKVTGNKQAVMQAIGILISEEYFTVADHGRKYLRSSQPYRAPKDGPDAG